MRHSTLPEWMQNGQEKAVSSFTAGIFRDAIFELADFLFPIAGTVDPLVENRPNMQDEFEL
jgi:hypothetical protein